MITDLEIASSSTPHHKAQIVPATHVEDHQVPPKHARMPAIISTTHVWELMLPAARTEADPNTRILTMSPATNAQTKGQTATKLTPTLVHQRPDVAVGTLDGSRK